MSTDSKPIRSHYARPKAGTVNKWGVTVVRETGRAGRAGHVILEMRCHCGNTYNMRAYRASRSQSCGCKRRLPDGEAAFNALYNQYARNAECYGREWSIGRELFRELTQRDCAYCGVGPSSSMSSTLTSSTGTYIYNGLDRVDNALGYSEGNVVPCCAICNRAKFSRTPAEWEAWLERVTEFRSRTCQPKCPPPE